MDVGQSCTLEGLGITFRFPAIGCRWKRVSSTRGYIRVQRFVPEDEGLAQRMQLLLSVEDVPWDMPLSTYRDLCKLQWCQVWARLVGGSRDRPLLSGWLILYRGGGVRGQKKVCVPKIDLQVRAPLINFIFFPRKNFLMWVGGWVSQNPGGPI